MKDGRGLAGFLRLIPFSVCRKRYIIRSTGNLEKGVSNETVHPWRPMPGVYAQIRREVHLQQEVPARMRVLRASSDSHVMPGPFPRAALLLQTLVASES